jgi:hypothetical protein
MKNATAILFLTALCFSGCVFSSNRESSNATTTVKPASNQNAAAEKPSAGNGANQPEKKADDSKAAAQTDCLNTRVAGKKTDEKQTFAFDHEPFKNACFVTAHDAEYDDPPLNSEFFIYKNGKEVYKFPNQFNGVTTGCWAEAVAFQDLNEDNLTDVILVGKCSAKTAPYNENMVYVNKGKEFTTNEEANYTLEKFKKIKDIADFVKANKEQFFQ